MSDLVSVIIPVYNVSGYLRACLESLQNQTYQNLEILLIDDGSTDGSIESVRAMVERDDRIKVFRQSNQGAATARNKGLDEARGDYIFFVDADDWVTTDAVARLYRLTQEFHTKLAVSGVAYHNENGEIDKQSTFPRGIFTTAEVVQMMYASDHSILLGAGKFFHRDLVQELRFPVGKLVEDAFFQPRLYQQAGTIALEPEPLYHYNYQREGNASSALVLKKYSDHLEAMIGNLLLYARDKVIRHAIVERCFDIWWSAFIAFKTHEDDSLIEEVLGLYWRTLTTIPLVKKWHFFMLYLRFYGRYWIVNKLKKRQWSKFLLEQIRQQKNLWQQGKSNRKLRLPAFKEGLAQIKRVGYYAYTVGYYIQVPKVPVCYLDNAKVASTAIKETLLLASGGSLENLFENDLHMHFKQHFVKPIESGVPLLEFSFIFVRNPFERVVSTYKNMYNANKVWSTFKVYLFGYFKKDRGFDYFVRKGPVRIPDRFADTHLVSQHILVYDGQGQSQVDFIGRFEHLVEDWKVVQEKAGLPDLPVRNQTAKDDWRDYYTVELVEMVYRRYQKDIEVFGYEEEYIKLKAYLEEKEKERAGI